MPALPKSSFDARRHCCVGGDVRERHEYRAWCVLLALLLSFLAGCAADPAPRKRSFMASATTRQTADEVPVGLNPLGSLDTCLPGSQRSGPHRVLISRPEHFTQEASLMISALRDALAAARRELPAVEFLLAPREVRDLASAREMGHACVSMIVLWEPGATKTLELTLPDPTRVPLRELVQERLCEFGSHTEQLNILYLTIAGLLSLRENQYDRAVLYMNSARAIDTHCLHLPGASATDPSQVPSTRPGLP